MQALEGIRVLDFGRFVAAPWCAALLGDLGADVIRVEKIDGGEDRWVQPVTEGGEGATFLQCNRNKRAITLDTRTPEGAEVMRKLVATADVVVVNMPEKALRTNGLDYDSLKAVKPDIIMAFCTAFGVGGPYSERVGYDGIGQVMSGTVFRTGTPDHPTKYAAPVSDFATALSLAFGVVAALHHRTRTGQGQRVEASLLGSSLMMANSLLIEEALLGRKLTAMGNRTHAAAPADLFRVKDGWVIIQIAGQDMFKRWCALVGENDWYDDPRFANDTLRGEHGDIINGRMQAWCAEKTKTDVLAALEKAKLPAGVMLAPWEVLEEPHIKAMNYLKPVMYPGSDKPVPSIDTPVRFSETPGSIRMRPPLLGEHTDAVLAELGYSGDQISGLRQRKVI